MNKTGRTLIIVGMSLAGALLASALMIKVTPNDSWAAFAGWVIFFAALQSPLFMFRQSSWLSCAAWLTRLVRK
jgi:hypothetical protein